MILHIVYSSVMCIVVPTLGFPTGSVSDLRFGNSQKNFAIVEGPREFMMPLVPIGDSLLPVDREGRSIKTMNTRTTDLDYMVYGKLYLLKAMRDKSTGLTAESNEPPSPNSNSEYSLTDRSILKNQYPDSLLFPATTPRSKRPYRYKSWSQLQKLQTGDLARYHHNRRIEERSADLMNSSEKPSMPMSSAQSVGTFSKTETDEPSNLDEEAIELIEQLISQKPQIEEISKTTDQSNISLIQENDTDSTSDNFELDNRFLIKVPSKPNYMQCPEGQKRTHLGTCKPVLVQKPSSSSGPFGPVGIASNSASRKNNQPLNRRWDNLPRFELTTLFRSVVQLEKVLEKTIKDAEKQISSTQIQNEENSTTVSIDGHNMQV